MSSNDARAPIPDYYDCVSVRRVDGRAKFLSHRSVCRATHTEPSESEPKNINKMNEYIVKEVNDRVVALRVIRMAISRQMQIDCDAAAPERRQSSSLTCIHTYDECLPVDKESAKWLYGWRVEKLCKFEIALISSSKYDGRDLCDKPPFAHFVERRMRVSRRKHRFVHGCDSHAIPFRHMIMITRFRNEKFEWMKRGVYSNWEHNGVMLTNSCFNASRLFSRYILKNWRLKHPWNGWKHSVPTKIALQNLPTAKINTIWPRKIDQNFLFECGCICFEPLIWCCILSLMDKRIKKSTY